MLIITHIVVLCKVLCMSTRHMFPDRSEVSHGTMGPFFLRYLSGFFSWILFRDASFMVFNCKREWGDLQLLASIIKIIIRHGLTYVS